MRLNSFDIITNSDNLSFQIDDTDNIDDLTFEDMHSRISTSTEFLKQCFRSS